MGMSNFLVAALYKFVQLPDFPERKDPLLAVCVKHGVKGTLLLAREGLNGTIAGPADGVRAVLDYLRSDTAFEALVHKESWAEEMPFLRMKVRLKKEIVTMGVEDVDPNHIVGTYVQPDEWNALISDPNVVVVDTRNDYEVEIGTFKNALNPATTTFREFPQWVADHKDELEGRKIAMFCTGGIRCEKSTNYMKQQGYPEVFHLDGGILKYLETVPEEKSLWEGECFVFDQRVSVKHGLEEGTYDQCYGCRYPITDEDKQSEHYMAGVCCPRCHDTLTADQRKRFSDRHKQIGLAKKRGEVHLGDKPGELSDLQDEGATPISREG